jgi:hypothetical protein
MTGEIRDDVRQYKVLNAVSIPVTFPASGCLLQRGVFSIETWHK